MSWYSIDGSDSERNDREYTRKYEMKHYMLEPAS